MTAKLPFKIWCLVCVATLTTVLACVHWLDVPVARMFFGNARHLSQLGEGFSSTAIVTGEIIVIVALAIARLARGSLPIFAKSVFVSSCASLSAFVANDYILKVIFGRQSPMIFLQNPTSQVFHLFEGNQKSSFPSGHMVLATAFALAMMRLQPNTKPVLFILLGIGSIALLAGDWHFLGDVVAGAFVGGTAGFVAGELWSEHIKLRSGKYQLKT